MIELRINGVALVLLPATDVVTELLNTALSEGLEDGFSLPFEAPVKGNELVLGFVDVRSVRSRTLKYPDARLYYYGALKHAGVLYVEDVEDGVVQMSFSVDGFVAELKERTLKDVDYGDPISISSEVLRMQDWAYLRNVQPYPDSSHCFPMFYNPELQGEENPDYFPDHPKYNPTQSYAVNDLVTFEVGSPVRRQVNYQCIVSSSPGQNPTTHPSQWRRTAYGIVNHWDHATGNFFVNNLTDGNPYAMVPMFYLKWVLKKVFADMGYTLAGNFMDDVATHTVALTNNTALDDGTRAGFLCVAQAGGQVMGSTPAVLQANTETGGTLSDVGGLWNNTTGRFTCDSAGRRYFQLVLAITFSAGAVYFIRLVDDATNTVLRRLQVSLDAALDYNTTYTLNYDFTGGQVGLDFRLEIEAYYAAMGVPTLLYVVPAGANVTAFTLTSWLADTTSLLNQLTLSIDPKAHVPDQSLAEFLLDMCDLFTLERVFDLQTRTAYLNYRKHTLSDTPLDVTHLVRSPIKQLFQEAPQGYRFSFDTDEVDLTDRDQEITVDTEDDLVAPLSQRSYVLVRNSRRLYISKAGTDGVLAWHLAGWDLSPVTIGSNENPREVKPTWQPALMDLVWSNGERFLVPYVSEAGNSAMFSTSRNEPAKRLVVFHSMLNNANAVAYPFATSFGREDSGAPFGNLSLYWTDTDGLLPKYGEAYYTALLDAIVLELDIEVTPELLRAVQNRALLITNQRCLIERLPLTYSDSRQALVSEGARIYQIPAP